MRIGSRFVLYDYSSILDFRSELCYTIHNTVTKEMNAMNESPRCLYHNSFSDFLREDENAILGLLCDHYHGDAHTTTREAWYP